jgi:predicted HTH transcriptional regulator
MAQKLLVLESRLRVAHAAGLVATEHLNVFVAEIDTVLRSIRSYTEDTNVGHVLEGSSASFMNRGQSRTGQRHTMRHESQKKGEFEGPASPQEARTTNRTDRILSVLKAQPSASIKDITDTIKDVSEKTIQRDLNALIKDGVIKREGERRWSKYSVVFL